MAKAYSTIGTVLNYGSEANNLTELCKIKSYPDMGGAPSMLEVAYVSNTADTPGYYSLVFGTSGEDGYGKFTFQGQHSVYISGGDVNAVREMVITIAPSSDITFATT